MTQYDESESGMTAKPTYPDLVIRFEELGEDPGRVSPTPIRLLTEAFN